MELLTNLRNSFILFAAKKAEGKIDGRDITRGLDVHLDMYLGKKSKEAKQTIITPLLFEAIEGLYEDCPEDLVPIIMQWVVDIRKTKK